jgi:ABC-2 type transport system ATP-binding protein
MSFLHSVPKNAVEISGLVKVFPSAHGPCHALKNVDLTIPQGTLFGLLGPNGAGKSTLINILAGIFRKTAGDVFIWDTNIDEDSRRTRAAIGVVPQELNNDPFFTPRETLEQQAGLFGIPRKERITNILLEMVGLEDVADGTTRMLSGGMKRRLMVAKALVHRPPVLILDEPTAGVDVGLRRSLWDQILKLKETGTTILLTTHYLEEAEALCDNIAILNQGQIIANSTKIKLLAQLDKKQITITVDRDLHDVPPNLKPHGWELEDSRHLKIATRPIKMSLGQMLLSVQVNGLNITDIVTEESDLEDVFLELTKEAS